MAPPAGAGATVYGGRFEELQEIGTGSFGKCKLVRRISDGNLLVAKEISVKELSEAERALAQKEVDILAKLHHPCIVGLHESFIEGNHTLCIIMDYADGGDMSQLIEKHAEAGTPFPEEEVMDWFVQLLLALKHIHDRHILHRDLKTANVFLTSRYNIVKLGDFGIARVLQSDTDMAKTMVGTPFYLSPEVCMNAPYDTKSDVWSLGCCVYELVTLKRAFHAQNVGALIMKILRGDFPPPPAMYSEQLRHTISLMLRRKPEERPSVAQLLAMPFVKNRIRPLMQKLHQYVVGQAGAEGAEALVPPPTPGLPAPPAAARPPTREAEKARRPGEDGLRAALKERRKRTNEDWMQKKADEVRRLSEANQGGRAKGRPEEPPPAPAPQAGPSHARAERGPGGPLPSARKLETIYSEEGTQGAADDEARRAAAARAADRGQAGEGPAEEVEEEEGAATVGRAGSSTVGTRRGPPPGAAPPQAPKRGSMTMGRPGGAGRPELKPGAAHFRLENLLETNAEWRQKHDAIAKDREKQAAAKAAHDRKREEARRKNAAEKQMLSALQAAKQGEEEQKRAAKRGELERKLAERSAERAQKEEAARQQMQAHAEKMKRVAPRISKADIARAASNAPDGGGLPFPEEAPPAPAPAAAPRPAPARGFRSASAGALRSARSDAAGPSAPAHAPAPAPAPGGSPAANARPGPPSVPSTPTGRTAAAGRGGAAGHARPVAGFVGVPRVQGAAAGRRGPRREVEFELVLPKNVRAYVESQARPPPPPPPPAMAPAGSVGEEGEEERVLEGLRRIWEEREGRDLVEVLAQLEALVVPAAAPSPVGPAPAEPPTPPPAPPAARAGEAAEGGSLPPSPVLPANLSTRIEALRQYCEQHLGAHFLPVYKLVTEAYGGKGSAEGEEALKGRIAGLLPGPKRHMLRYVQQLVFCEDRFYGGQGGDGAAGGR